MIMKWGKTAEFVWSGGCDFGPPPPINDTLGGLEGIGGVIFGGRSNLIGNKLKDNPPKSNCNMASEKLFQFVEEKEPVNLKSVRGLRQ